MNRIFVISTLLLFFYYSTTNCNAQIISYFTGHVSDTTMNGWLMTKKIKTYTLLAVCDKQKISTHLVPIIHTYRKYRYSTYTFHHLQPAQHYIIYCILDKKDTIQLTTITTPNSKDTTSPDFSFLTGSCAYIGTYKPTDCKRIFTAMAKENAEFMLWLGDNLYYVFPDLTNYYFTKRKNTTMRRQKQLKGFLKTMQQYAIWDDHDFGFNNVDSSFTKKHLTKKAFQEFWANPSYTKGSTIYYNFQKYDTEFFCIDDKSHCKWTDSTVISPEQMHFLQQDLLHSKAVFKFIVNGMQTTNAYCAEPYASMPSKQHKEIIQFIHTNKIQGVVFISGDRHFAELLKTPYPQAYPIFELTTSPLTSWPLTPKEATNPLCVKNTVFVANNYAKININGTKNNRICTLQLKDKQGNTIWEYTIPATLLHYPTP